MFAPVLLEGIKLEASIPKSEVSVEHEPSSHPAV